MKESTIISLAGQSTYRKGLHYFSSGRVVNMKSTNVDLGVTIYHAQVKGSGAVPYDVSVELTKGSDAPTFYDCSCPAQSLYSGACKHIVAVMKAIQEMEHLPESKKVNRAGGEAERALFAAFSPRKESRGEPLKLAAKFCSALHSNIHMSWLEMKIGRERMYVLKSYTELMKRIKSDEDYYIGKQLTLKPGEIFFDDDISKGLWRLIKDTYEDEVGISMPFQRFYGYSQLGSTHFSGKKFFLSPVGIARFFEIMGDDDFCFEDDAGNIWETCVQQGNPPIRFEVAESRGAVRLALARGSERLCALEPGYRYVLCGDQVYHLDESDAREMRSLFSVFARYDNVNVTKDRMVDFFERVLPGLERVSTVSIAKEISRKYEKLPLTPEVHLDYEGDGLSALLTFKYGETAFNPLTETAPKSSSGRKLIRDVSGEAAVTSFFDGWEKSGQGLLLPDEKASYEFLTGSLPRLSETADVYYSEKFQSRPVRRMPPVSVGVSISDNNLLEITFDGKGFDFDELMRVLTSYRLKKKYHRLADGGFLTLGGKDMEALSDFVENVGYKKGKNSALAPLATALYVDELARHSGGLKLAKSKGFRELVRDIREAGTFDTDVPASLTGVLREYQTTGFSWISALANYGFGGILADDMGLGKTLETISFLLARKKEGQPPALVVAPTSLIYNWLAEIEKFAPDLKAAAIAGTAEERRDMMEEAAKNNDVLITTYGMLRRDIEDYEKMTFSCCVLDEAQKIKNPQSQAAKAAKRVNTPVRLALTGTPIENNLTELWSIFDFLMPGYLGTHALFRKRYELPIAHGEAGRAEDLRRRIAPFVLRRLKKDVLAELPDKTESAMVNEMTEEQAKVYKAYFVQSQKEFAEELAVRGFEQSRIKILSILTRLRQIACDPSIFLEDYHGGSGKLDMLEDLVPEAARGGHRILIFSQFTTMLHHIAERLDALGVEYFYLDGGTPALERMRLVKEFNAGGPPVFLISLKAGGTGLNLTGADMVIHYDPWWNPAVEDQATDRAYRIGQMENVQVLKFVTKDTVEEKIFELKEKKKALTDALIQPGESFISKLSEDEIRDLFR